MDLTREVFSIRNEEEFNAIALKIFRYQLEFNKIYRQFIESAGISIRSTTDYREIPFMPIEFFRNHDIICGETSGGKTFLSSGTTGSVQSRHNVLDINVYEISLLRGFELFYGPPSAYHILGLMPSPEENPSSSLVYMVNTLIGRGTDRQSGFFLHDFTKLKSVLNRLASTSDKVMLIGLSYALLDFIHAFHISFPGLIVMETGGMKGRKRELIREELHHELCEGFGVRKIHSEYGMTELLSQAYSHGDGIFQCPPWMKILIREPNDPFRHVSAGISGGINVIDLANYHSCSFIATQDIGKSYADGSFEVLGRFAYSDTRGCNLMAGQESGSPTV
jgi:hypothetical protein